MSNTEQKHRRSRRKSRQSDDRQERRSTVDAHVFVHDLKVTLDQWSVHGDKTNEPGCLKKHLETLFDAYPGLKLLTGDAIYAQRPLLEVLHEHGCDYLFQLKENHGEVYDAVKYCFHDAGNTEPDDVSLSKKRRGRGSQNVVRH